MAAAIVCRLVLLLDEVAWVVGWPLPHGRGTDVAIRASGSPPTLADAVYGALGKKLDAHLTEMAKEGHSGAVPVAERGLMVPFTAMPD